MALLTGDNTPLPESNEALVLTGSAVFASGNAATSATIALGSLAPSGITGNAFDAKNAVVAIANNGSGQMINAATLSFVDTLGAQNATISYTISSVSIANNANATFEVPLPSGILKNAQLAVTFASAPTAGSVATEVVLQGQGGGTPLVAGTALIGGVEIYDSAGTNKLAIDSSGRITLVPNGVMEIGDGTTPTQKLAIDSLGRVTMVPNQVFELGDGTTPTQKLAIDSSGNASVNVGKINGVAPTMGNGASGTGVQRVTLASDSTGQVALAAGANNVGAFQQATSNAAVAAGTTTSAQVIKASAGYLAGALVTSAGTVALSIYDNASAASGTPIGYIPANPTAGTFYPFNMPDANGIVAGKVNNSSGVTLAFS